MKDYDFKNKLLYDFINVIKLYDYLNDYINHG